MKLVYVPVVTHPGDYINAFFSSCLVNPLRKYPQIAVLMESFRSKEFFADSGGYQMYSLNQGERKKQCVVVPGVGIRDTRDHLIIDPIDLCRRYGKLRINYGFSLDFPLSDDPSEQEYVSKLEASFEWAEMMFDVRPKLCPETKLLIPLHYETKSQLHQYFDKMTVLKPEGYGLPVRGRFNLDGLIWIASSLAFLHSKGVRLVHAFGSSRRELIMIGAAALGLGMFSRLSFDSTSWDCFLSNRRPYRIDTKTLAQKRILPTSSIPVLLPTELLHTVGRLEGQPTAAVKKRLIALHNALAITRYTYKTARRAKDLVGFKNYLQKEPHLALHKEDLLIAISLLEHASLRGYDHVSRSLDWIW
jgi:hypothetical protein